MKDLKNFARANRKNMTDAETRLWYQLRTGRLGGYKFRRQVQIGPYIVDFLCKSAKLIIEVDGEQHAESPKDVIRTQYLRGSAIS